MFHTHLPECQELNRRRLLSEKPTEKETMTQMGVLEETTEEQFTGQYPPSSSIQAGVVCAFQG